MILKNQKVSTLYTIQWDSLNFLTRMSIHTIKSNFSDLRKRRDGNAQQNATIVSDFKEHFFYYKRATETSAADRSIKHVSIYLI